MRYKFIFFILFLSIVVTQHSQPTYFNRISSGGNLDYSDSRSMAMGNTFYSTGSTSSIISRNPSKLGYLTNNILVDFQNNLHISFERRSIDILDGWGEFLTETDYVFNQHTYDYQSLGFIYNKQFQTFDIGFGFNYKPLTTFDYSYEEEIRGDADFADGVLGIRDPIIGYHIYNNRGQLNVASIGFGITRKDKKLYLPTSFGISINKILSSEVTDKLLVDTLYNTADPYDYDNMSNALETINTYKIDKVEHYITASLELPLTKESLLILSYESEASAMTNNVDNIDWSFSQATGLPWILDFNDQNQLVLKTLEVDFLKPERVAIGLLHSPMYDKSLVMAFELVQENYSNEINKKIEEYKVGFEYQPKIGYPIRAGLSYKEPYFGALDPVTILTLGTGKKINNLDIDVALNYSNTNYRNLDIFPLIDLENIDCNQDCDKIIENNLTFSTNFKWSF